jgi:hypothetical protein
MKLYIYKNKKSFPHRHNKVMLIRFGTHINICFGVIKKYSYELNRYDGSSVYWADMKYFEPLDKENIYIKKCKYIHGNCKDLFRNSSIPLFDWWIKKFKSKGDKNIINSLKKNIQSTCNKDGNLPYVGIISDIKRELNIIIEKNLYTFNLSHYHDIYNRSHRRYLNFPSFIEKISKTKVEKGLKIKQ